MPSGPEETKRLARTEKLFLLFFTETNVSVLLFTEAKGVVISKGAAELLREKNNGSILPKVLEQASFFMKAD
ncbi:MAG: hypothetical protein FWF07_03550, partial [Methanomassiliicoccaceae archaeon]|nr:hypothetical protein [Methanomassiliicoccaceae archaeon]